MKVSANGITKTSALMLLLLAGITVGASRPEGQEAREKSELPEGAQYLPQGEARRLMLQGCVQCHDLRNTVSQRKTAAGWRRTVDEMIWRGAPLMSDEAEAITKYLAESFGPDKPIPDALKKKSVNKR